MQKIFDEQVVGKLKEDREHLMNARPSDWSGTTISTDITNSSIDHLRSRQKEMLGGKLNKKSDYCVKLIN